MLMTTVQAQGLTAGFYGGNQNINLGSPATIEFRFNGDGPVDFSYYDGTYFYHQYGIETSPYTFQVWPNNTTTYELRVVKNRFGNGQVEETHRFTTITVENGNNVVSMTFAPPSVCENGNPIMLENYLSYNIIPQQVWFEGNGVSGNVFYPQLAEAGNHTLRAYILYNGTTYSVPQNISVYEMPEVSLWLPNEVSTNDAQFVLSGGRPSGGYYWGDCVVNGNIFNPAIAGEGWHTIYYSYTTSYGCQDVAESKIYVRRSGYDVEETVENSLSIYPNPTNGIIHFNNPYSVEIFSTIGFVRRINTRAESIDISDLPAGVYTLKLFDGETTFIKKVVKKWQGSPIIMGLFQKNKKVIIIKFFAKKDWLLL